MYAMILGVAERLLQKFKRCVPETQVAFQGLSWYYPVYGKMAGLAILMLFPRAAKTWSTWEGC
ncbi:MAG: hypothetical protein ABDK94_08455 [Atribacterota bacterium]